MKLYGVCDGPPTLAVRLALAALDIPYEMIWVDYCKGEHMTEEYAKMNPSKEIPVLEDDGFFLPESIAIIQYVFDKYAPKGSPYYPLDVKQRALVNHRMLFNSCFYYKTIFEYAVLPLFFDVPRDDTRLMKLQNALSTFETYLTNQNTKYAAGNTVTVGDFCLISGTVYLEAIGFDISSWPMLKTWYETFKTEQSKFWVIVEEFLNWMKYYVKNKPEMVDHHLYPKKM